MEATQSLLCVVELLVAMAFLTIPKFALSSTLPLPPAVRCEAGEGCTVNNYMNLWSDNQPCKAAMVLYPKTEQDLIEAVDLAAKTWSKVKVVSASSHSLPKLVCPGGSFSQGIIISTRFYNSLIQFNETARTVTAHAGVMLSDLLAHMAAKGLTLPDSPVWDYVSVAGMISTGAHGSGFWGLGSSTPNHVTAIRLITATRHVDPSTGRHAKVVDLSGEDPDLDAARLSLGVLGAISTVTFALEPMFKRSVTIELRDDVTLEEDVVDIAKKHEFGSLNWFPSSGKFVVTRVDRVDVETEGNGIFDLPFLGNLDVDTVANIKALVEGRNINDICKQSEVVMESLYKYGDGFLNDGVTFTSFPVVGFNHKMQVTKGCVGDKLPHFTPTTIESIIEDEYVEQTSYNTYQSMINETLTTCFFHPQKGMAIFDSSIAIPISKAKEAIADIKKIRNANSKKACLLGIVRGIWMRYLPKSSAYLGDRTKSVVFEMFSYRSRDVNVPTIYQDVMEEIEQILLNKYQGKPHWGKNKDRAFQNMENRVVSLEMFLEARDRLDPLAIFSSDWSNAILGISSSVIQIQDNCALQGLCFCEKDSHCDPSRGYFCREGSVYKEAMVCKEEEMMCKEEM